jgi:hypothetical protein
MGWVKTLTDIATTPVRVGLAAADAGIEVAAATLDLAKRSLGDATVPSPKDSVVHILGLDDTMERANRFAQLIEEDAPLGRALAPGGLVDKLLAEDGLVDRVFAEDGIAQRLLAEGGLIERLTVKDGPLEQLASVTDTLNRLAPGLESLAPTIETLREAVVTLSLVVNPLSNIAERIPLPGRRRWPFRDDDE